MTKTHHFTIPTAALLAAVFTLFTSATARAQDTLKHTIPGPPLPQIEAQLGFAVATNGTVTVVGAPFDDVPGIDAGVVKVFASGTGALLHVIPNPAGTGDDGFGEAVAIAGSVVVIGAPRYDTNPSAGIAYVYDLNGATPTEPLFTLNSDGGSSVQFGNAVAISGTRVVVGASNHSSGAGRAYVFDLSSGTPTTAAATLQNPAASPSDQFGFSVAISGTRVVVGANQDDAGGTDAGTVYVYELTSGTPTTPVLTLNNPSAADGDQFGSSVAVEGARVVVGTPGNTLGQAGGAGSAYIFDVSSGTPTAPVTTLNNPSPAANDRFGYRVAISATRVAVGAYQDDAAATDSGTAYVYDVASGTPTVPVATLNNPTPAAADEFGCAVAIAGTSVVVGARLDDTAARDAGSAYLYDVSGGTPSVPVRTLSSPSPSRDDQFGNAVAISGKLLAVAMWQDDTGEPGAGSVYVYDLSSATPLAPLTKLNNPSPQPGDDGFGASLAFSGTRLVVGAPGAAGAGTVYVYDLGSATPTLPAVLDNPAPAGGDGFGSAVAISGTYVVVGAPRDDATADDGGTAYVYDLSSGMASVPVATLNNPEPTSLDGYGSSVAVSGTYVAVGVPDGDATVTGGGMVYVYDLSSGTRDVPIAALPDPDPRQSHDFGASLAMSDNRLLVGNPFAVSVVQGGGARAGSAHLYDLTSGTPTGPVTFRDAAPTPVAVFGTSVAISGTRIIIGAPLKTNGTDNVGAAYVFDLSSGTPTVAIATIFNPEPGAGDRFGAAVAISGTRAVIGAPGDDSSQPDKGSAYVYVPANVAPVAQDQSVTTNEETAVAVTLSAIDANSDPLTFSIVTQPANGTLSGTPPNLTYTPNAGYSGLDSFTFKANDGQADSNVATVSITVNEGPGPSPSPSPTVPPVKALNISTRLRVETGSNVMIAGFIITGDTSKKVIIRALGPSLGASGVDNAIADPVLELRGSTGELIFSNNNWRDTQEDDVNASTVPPPNDLEAAIVATLQPGAYTAIVSGVNETTGIGLVEVYDLDGPAPSELANISTRGLVLTESNVLIGGFILGGNAINTRVVVRALGPSLADGGVANALADPTLDLRDGNGAPLVFNDNWADDAVQAAELTALNIAPPNAQESALVLRIPPGNYTGIVSGKNGGTGVGLVEVYNVQ